MGRELLHTVLMAYTLSLAILSLIADKNPELRPKETKPAIPS